MDSLRARNCKTAMSVSWRGIISRSCPASHRTTRISLQQPKRLAIVFNRLNVCRFPTTRRSFSRSVTVMTDSDTHLETLKATFKRLANIPIATGGWVKSNPPQAMLTYSQRDLVRQKKPKLLRNFFQGANGTWNNTPFGLNLGNVVAMQPSPSWKLLCVFRQADKKDPEEKDKYSIEIWDDAQMITSIPTDLKHGAVYGDNWFGSISWSSDEKFIAYVAEKNPDKVAGFFDLEQKDDVRQGTKFELKEDWGETYKGGNPTIYVASIENDGGIYQIENVPQDVSFGQVQWSPVSDELVFVGWSNNPRRLGIIHCFNRPSAIYSIKIDREEILKSFKPQTKEAAEAKNKEQGTLEQSKQKPDTTTVLTKLHPISRSPRFSPDGRQLVYLAMDSMGTHNGCSRLCVLDLETQKENVVVDYVETPASDKEFPGIFCNFLPPQPFIDSHTIVFDTQWRAVMAVVKVDLESSALTRLVLSGVKDASTTVISVAIATSTSPPTLLLECSSPNEVPRQVVGFIDPSYAPIRWTPLPISQHQKKEGEFIRNSLKYQIATHNNVEYIYVSKASNGTEEKTPLILFPHGGPHSGSISSYTISMSLFALMGYAAVFINFRGSLGYGKAFVNALPGHAGEYDVDDCVSIGKHLLNTFPNLDASRVYAYGGSHGGFLTGHLIARPDIQIRAASMVNAVTNMAHSVGTTDIPDWNYVEAGVSGFNSDSMKVMFDKSPIAHVSKVTTPTLVIAGTADKRCPPSQSYEYFFKLKEHGCEARLLKYPGAGHGIIDAEHEADYLLNTLMWFDAHQK